MLVPLIQCERNDAHRYYRECLVFFNNKPHMFVDKDGAQAVLLDASNREVRVPYNDVSITILDPFYNKDGEYYGHTAGRRTSRGIPYPRSWYGDVKSMLDTGDVKPCTYTNGIRINKDFRTLIHRGVITLMYRSEYVGFLHGDTYYVVDSFIAERLLGVNNELSVQVIPK